MRSRVAVGDGPGAVPRAEHGLDRAAELVRRVLRERLAGRALARRPCSAGTGRAASRR